MTHRMPKISIFIWLSPQNLMTRPKCASSIISNRIGTCCTLYEVYFPQRSCSFVVKARKKRKNENVNFLFFIYKSDQPAYDLTHPEINEILPHRPVIRNGEDAGKILVGHKLRRLRRPPELSQTAMSILDISPSYLNLLEHNQRPLTVALLLPSAIALILT